MASQASGRCGHRKAHWDTHPKCLSCCGCSSDAPCAVSQLWSEDTWAAASRRRRHASRGKRQRSPSSERDFDGFSSSDARSPSSRRSVSASSGSECENAVGTDPSVSSIQAPLALLNPDQVLTSRERASRSPTRRSTSGFRSRKASSTRTAPEVAGGSKSSIPVEDRTRDRPGGSVHSPSGSVRSRSPPAPSADSVPGETAPVTAVSDRPGTRPGRETSVDRSGDRPGMSRPGDRPGKSRQGDRPGTSRPGSTRDRPGDRPGTDRPGDRPGSRHDRSRSDWPGLGHDRSVFDRSGTGRDSPSRVDPLSGDSPAFRADRSRRVREIEEMFGPSPRWSDRESDWEYRARGSHPYDFVSGCDRAPWDMGYRELLRTRDPFPWDAHGPRSFPFWGRDRDRDFDDRRDYPSRDSSFPSQRASATTSRREPTPPPEDRTPHPGVRSDRTPASATPPAEDVLSIRAPGDDPLFHEHVDEVSTQGDEDDPSTQGDEDPVPTSFSLSGAYQTVLDVLPEDICPPPPPPPPRSSGSVAESIIWGLHPEQQPQRAPLTSLPLSPLVKEAAEKFDELQSASPSMQWSLPPKAVRSVMANTAYRPPCPDSSSGLDLSSVAQLDADAQRAKVSKLGPSASVPLSLSTLESWEQRERQSMGLASQIDFFAATVAKLASSPKEESPERLHQVLLFLGRSAKNLAATSTANMVEMLRLRRSALLSSSHFLLENSRNRLLTASIRSPDLFGGLVSEVVSADKDDQLHASVAVKSPKPPKTAFKRPAQSAPPSKPSQAKKKRPPQSKAPASGPPRSLEHRSPLQSLHGKGRGKGFGQAPKGSPSPRPPPRPQP